MLELHSAITLGLRSIQPARHLAREIGSCYTFDRCGESDRAASDLGGGPWGVGNRGSPSIGSVALLNHAAGR